VSRLLDKNDRAIVVALAKFVVVMFSQCSDQLAFICHKFPSFFDRAGHQQADGTVRTATCYHVLLILADCLGAECLAINLDGFCQSATPSLC